MRFKPFHLVVIAALIASCLVWSCSKNSTPPGGNPSSGATDTAASTLASASANANFTIDELLNVTIDVTIGYDLYSGTDRVESCATATLSPNDTTTFPKTLTLDFGSSCVGADGFTRTGKIIYTLSGKFGESGTTVTATFDNYTIAGYTLQGTYFVTNTSTTSAYSWNSGLLNGKITFPDNSYYTYSGNRRVAQTAGSTTLADPNNVYQLTGSDTLTSSGGNVLTENITTPLVKANSCAWVSEGVITFDFDGATGTLNYGNGTCDADATVSVGTVVKQITLL